MGRTQRQRLHNKKLRPSTTKNDNFPHELFQYMRQQGWQNETELSVRKFDATGRGLCSKMRTFAAGDRLISLPQKCLITIATLETDEAFKSQFNSSLFNKDQLVPFQALLALYILHQRHLGEQSPIDSYFRSVPTHFTTPYFCTLNELQCLPEALLEKTVAQNRKIRESLLNLKSHFANTNCDCCGQNYFSELYTLEAFKWAYFVVNSRSVFVCSRQVKPAKMFFQSLLSDEPKLALAPLLDLFNHTDVVTTSAELQRNNVTKTQEFVITLVTVKNAIVRPYSEIFINYGALPNLKLLTEYGFILHDNAHDYFEFSLLDIENLIRQERCFQGQIFHRNKFRFIRDHNLHDALFVHSSDGISHNLRVVLHLIFKEPSHFPNVLNQVAFGAVDLLADVEVEVRLLLDFKIAEYRGFIGDLSKLSELSESGIVAQRYMQECVRYLSICLQLLSSKQ